MSSIIINFITIFFIVLILAYSITNIVINNNLHNFINESYKNISYDYKRSKLYQDIKSKYNKYIIENPYAEISITSFIEEVCSDFTFKNKVILDKIKSIKKASSNCILLGVLGTFTGLSMMLLSINTNDIINSLPQTISSMQTAFITSIVGIVTSIIINIILDNKDCEGTLVQLMLKLENILTAETTHKKSQDIDEKIEDVKNTIKEISTSIKCIERFDDISRNLIMFNEEFISGIESLRGLLEGSQTSIKTFDQSIRKLDKQFSIMNMKFTQLFNTFEGHEEINKEILIDIKETSKNISIYTENQLKSKDYLRSLSASFALYERTSQDLLNKLINHENRITKTQSELNEEQINLDTTVKHLASVIAISSQDIEQKLNMIFDYIDIYKEASTINAMQNEKFRKEDSEEIYEVDNSSTELSRTNSNQKLSPSKRIISKFNRNLIGDEKFDK